MKKLKKLRLELTYRVELDELEISDQMAATLREMVENNHRYHNTSCHWTQIDEERDALAEELCRIIPKGLPCYISSHEIGIQAVEFEDGIGYNRGDYLDFKVFADGTMNPDDDLRDSYYSK